MRERHRFRPEGPESLENRQVLHAGVRITPLVASHLNLSGRHQFDALHSVSNQVNQDFDTFTQDYLQAEGTYFAAPSSNSKSARGLLDSFTRQRIDLLAQQLTQSMSRLPGSLNRLTSSSFGAKGSLVLQVFLRNRIDGTGDNSLREALAPSRTVTADQNPLPAPGSDAATISLYTNRAVTSIETARAATLNAVNLLVNHTFQ